MTILFTAFWVPCWSHTSGVMQDRCAHLLSTLQQSPLLRVSVMSQCVSEEVDVVDLPEQQECQLSVSNLPSQWPSQCWLPLDCEVPSLILKWQLMPS